MDVTNISHPMISTGSKNLMVAAYSNHKVRDQINTILTNVPIISALWYPNDKS